MVTLLCASILSLPAHTGHAAARGLPPPELAARLDALLTQQFHNRQFSGAVLVAQNGRVLLARGYGLADQETATPNTPDTRFFLGSLTKAFTAMALLILQERGKLQVQDPLCTYIPNCPPPWRTLSIHELLTHTSGIPQLDDSRLSNASPAAWIASFDTAPLQFRPGGEFQYCSICYQILAYVVQQVCGMPYSQFVQQAVLDPLHMTASGFDAPAYYAQASGARGYESWQVPAPQESSPLAPQWSFLSGSGLLYASVNDLYRWEQALSTHALVAPSTLTQIFTPYVQATLFPNSAYGYGWFLTRAPVPEHQLIWHDGVIDGFRSFIGRYVEDHTTILFASNLATLDLVALAHALETVIFARTSTI
jgi:CubicO group peptidase (beta-lactamase class C family)